MAFNPVGPWPNTIISIKTTSFEAWFHFSRIKTVGVIEVDMFPEDVDSPEHPMAESFKELLEEVAASYDCELLSFEINRGTVAFSFDNDELVYKILKILQSENPEIKE